MCAVRRERLALPARSAATTAAQITMSPIEPVRARSSADAETEDVGRLVLPAIRADEPPALGW
jgi:hypothetical protein